MENLERLPDGTYTVMGHAVPQPSRVNASDLIVQHSIYHRRVGYEAVGGPNIFLRQLNSDVPSMIVPSFCVGEEWTAVPMGHIKAAGMFVIKNEEGVFTHNIPNAEERLEMAKRIIEVSFREPHSCDQVVLPQETQTFTPGRAGPIYMRCLAVLATVSLIVVPQ